MKFTLKKLRLIYLPFLLIAVVFIPLYTFLHWLLFIRTNTYPVGRIVLELWLPCLLPLVFTVLWLRPRVKLLSLKKKEKEYHTFYLLIAWLSLALPTVMAQMYLSKSAGKMTVVENVNEIGRHESTRYYNLKHVYFSKNAIGVQSEAHPKGRYNEKLDLSIYVALPVYARPEDTVSRGSISWLGISYTKEISNKLSDKEKQELFQAFAEASEKDFGTKVIGPFSYLERKENNDDADGYLEAIKKSPKYHGETPILLLGREGDFESRGGATLQWAFVVLGAGSVLWLLMIAFARFDTRQLKRFEKGERKGNRDILELLSRLKPHGSFFITPIIIQLNLLVFVIMVCAGLGFVSLNTVALLRWGANYRPMTIDGQWWRLLTSTFMHGGIIHILGNMYGLLFVGLFLEPLMGRMRFLLAYLIAGIIASAASIWWYEATVSVGASGAIFGLYGIFLALLLTKTFNPEFGKAFLGSTLVFVGLNLLMGFTGGVDNAAHVGGLISGLVIGFIFRLTLKPIPEDIDKGISESVE